YAATRAARPAPGVRPPTTYKTPSTATAAQASRGAGSGAFCTHVLVAGSYASTVARSSLPSEPPIAQMGALSAAAARRWRAGGLPAPARQALATGRSAKTHAAV